MLNPVAEALTGWSRAEAIGLPLDRIFQVVNEKTREAVESPVARVLRLGTTVGLANHTVLVAKDGTEWPIDDSGAPIRENGRLVGVVLVFRETSARQAAERERDQLLRLEHDLRLKLEHALATTVESEERFRTLADSAPVLVWMSGVDGVCTYFNKAWLDFTGRSLEDEIRAGWSRGVHPDDLRGCLGVYAQALATPQSFRMEYRLRGHDGGYRWMLDTGIPRYGADDEFVGLIGSCVDITERVRPHSSIPAFLDGQPPRALQDQWG